MEDICGTAFCHMSRHIAKCRQKEFVELLICHAVVLNGFAVSRFIRHVVGRVGHDQIGFKPVHTAFKRRWDFTYLGIDDSEAGIVGKKVVLGQDNYRRIVEWNALRKAINNELLTYKVNEDKLMGPYFISKKNLPEGEMIDPAVFTRIFKNKVIMYLFDDAAKQKRITLFGGCDEKAKNQYSKICREFDTKGVYIFCKGISSQFIDDAPEDDGE